MNIGVYLVGRGVGDDELALEVQLRQLQHQDRREGVVQQEGRPSDTTLCYETEIIRLEAVSDPDPFHFGLPDPEAVTGDMRIQEARG